MESHGKHLPAKTASALTLAALLPLVTIATSPGRASEAPPPILYVTSQLDHSVKAYDGTTGAFLRNAATGVGDPLDAVLAPDGSLLVTDGQRDSVKRFDPATGNFLGLFASAVSPLGMTVSG